MFEVWSELPRFFELGAYDPEMRLYGGEEMDLSFRIWQCGGRIRRRIERPAPRGADLRDLHGVSPAAAVHPGDVRGEREPLGAGWERVACRRALRGDAGRWGAESVSLGGRRLRGLALGAEIPGQLTSLRLLFRLPPFAGGNLLPTEPWSIFFLPILIFCSKSTSNRFPT